jgi:hypothetical protein
VNWQGDGNDEEEEEEEEEEEDVARDQGSQSFAASLVLCRGVASRGSRKLGLRAVDSSPAAEGG